MIALHQTKTSDGRVAGRRKGLRSNSRKDAGRDRDSRKKYHAAEFRGQPFRRESFPAAIIALLGDSMPRCAHSILGSNGDGEGQEGVTKGDNGCWKGEFGSRANGC